MRAAAAALLVAIAFTLAGCGGDGADDDLADDAGAGGDGAVSDAARDAVTPDAAAPTG